MLISTDFWAGYISGAAGIIVGNPLDLIKVRIQAGLPLLPAANAVGSSRWRDIGTLVRGAPAPVLGYGALNALLFVSYNRTLMLLHDDVSSPSSGLNVWVAGAVGGLATWVVSAPTELVKCRAQTSSGDSSSWSITRDVFKTEGLRGLYLGGVVTSLRDSIGYGF
ncbi:MAG: hypothetical protein M1815_000416 [Lichina confinis]|nr:MAG: hypothetical protein M1815_000416 [Lichina confinis]